MTRRFTARRVVTVGSVLLLGLTACGSESSPGVASAIGEGAHSSSASVIGTAQADQVRYAKCMRENGIQMSDPVDGKTNIKAQPGDEAKLQTAQNACKKFAPTVQKGSGGGVSAEDQEKALKFDRCMRENGVQMDDPDFSSGDVRLHVEGDPEQADIDAAQQACASLLPEPAK